MSAISRLFGWQTITWPAGARASSVHHARSVSSRPSVRSTCPLTVHAGPATRKEGSSGLMSCGSTMLSHPIARSTSWTAPV